MDETLRRRLVGATVLLAAAFLVASLLPDPAPRAAGRPRPAVTYDLRTGEAVGAVAPAAEPEQEPEAAAAAEAPAATTPRPALKVDDTLGASPGGYFVQIGSFGNKTNASTVLRKLFGAGLPAKIDMPTVDKKLWYRVRVGPYANEASAQEALVEVRKQGYPLAKLVKPEAAAGGG